MKNLLDLCIDCVLDHVLVIPENYLPTDLTDLLEQKYIDRLYGPDDDFIYGLY
jgi:hypothetical protein